MYMLNLLGGCKTAQRFNSYQNEMKQHCFLEYSLGRGESKLPKYFASNRNRKLHLFPLLHKYQVYKCLINLAVSHQYPLVKRTTFTVLSVMIMVAPCKSLFFGCISLMLVCFVYVFNTFILICFNISIFSLDKRKKIQTYLPPEKNLRWL